MGSISGADTPCAMGPWHRASRPSVCSGCSGRPRSLETTNDAAPIASMAPFRVTGANGRASPDSLNCASESNVDSHTLCRSRLPPSSSTRRLGVHAAAGEIERDSAEHFDARRGLAHNVSQRRRRFRCFRDYSGCASHRWPQVVPIGLVRAEIVTPMTVGILYRTESGIVQGAEYVVV